MVVKFNSENFNWYYRNQFERDLLRFLYLYRHPDLDHRDYALICDSNQKNKAKWENFDVMDYYAIHDRNLRVERDGYYSYLWGETTNMWFETSDSEEHIAYYAVCFAYLQMLVSTMYELGLGDEFCSCTGYPMISCGLGGVCHPYATMDEMEMLPRGQESATNIEENIHHAEPFMRREAEKFFCGEQRDDIRQKEKYDHIVSCVKPHFDEFWRQLMSEFSELKCKGVKCKGESNRGRRTRVLDFMKQKKS